MNHFFAAFRIPSFSLSLDSLTAMCLNVGLLGLYCFKFVELLRCRNLMQIFLTFEKFMAISSNILSSSFFLSSPPKIPIIHMYPYHM